MSIQQLDLLGGASVSRPSVKRSSGVVSTSVEAYRATDKHGRAAVVVRLMALWTEVCYGHTTEHTAQEIYDFAAYREEAIAKGDRTAGLQRVRCGLSDAKELGLVEHAGKRQCSVSGKTVVTWKLRTR